MASLSQNEAKAIEKNRGEKQNLKNKLQKLTDKLEQTTRDINDSADSLNHHMHCMKLTTGFLHVKNSKKSLVPTESKSFK